MAAISYVIIHTFVILSITRQALTQNTAVLNFEVVEELPNSFVGSVATSEHLLSLYNAETIARFRFDLTPQGNQDGRLFTIERESGTIRTNTTVGINREAHCPGAETCYVYIDVAVVEPIELFQVMTARISVLDINDDTPYFRSSNLDLTFSEAAQVLTTSRILTQAIDMDSPRYGVVEYHMMPRSDVFELRGPADEEDASLRLVVIGPLDRERQDLYEMEVIAVDGGQPALSATMTLTIHIDDDNDNAPIFSRDQYEAELNEDQPINEVFLSVTAADPDEGVNGQVSYSLSPNSEAIKGHIFGINTENGGLYLKSPLDYETQQEHVIDVIARDAGSDSSQVQTKVTISVKDVNDFVPKVTINALGGAKVMENSDPGTFVAYVSVFDADSGDNGRTQCSLDNGAFSLLSLAGDNQYTLNTRHVFDREETSQVLLTIECSDFGLQQLTGTEIITVEIGDENDNYPRFLHNEYTVSLNENNSAGEVITRIQATDPDQGENGHVTYTMANGAISAYMAINEDTGEVLARQPLDYELVKELTFEVIAKDGGEPSLNSSAIVTIQLIDTNDEAPEFLQQIYEFQIYENEADISRVGEVIAIDKDTPQWNEFRYFLQVSSEWNVFTVDPTSGVITTTTSLDRELVENYNFVVLAQDSLDQSLIGSATVSVTVLDKNDNRPYISFPSSENHTVSISTQIPIGQAVTQILADDRDTLDNGRLTYKFSRGNTDAVKELFDIDSISGAVFTRESLLNHDSETYILSVTVQDQGTPIFSANAELIIEIDSDVPYAGGSRSKTKDKSDDLVEQNNLRAIIAVSAVSAIIVVALILIIVLIKLRDRKKICKKNKTIMNGAPHYKIEHQQHSDEYGSKYDGVCHNQDVFCIEGQGHNVLGSESHQDLSDHQIIPTFVNGQMVDHPPIISDHGILYDKRLDKQTERPQHATQYGSQHPDIDVSSSTDVSTSDSGRGGSVDGEHSARQERHVPDILQSRTINNKSQSEQSSHYNANHRAPPPSYGSFLRQKSQRESVENNSSDAMMHSPAYSVDFAANNRGNNGAHSSPLFTHSSPNLSPQSSTNEHLPVIPTRSYRNSDSHRDMAPNAPKDRSHMAPTAPSFSTIQSSTSALANHCRVHKSKAPKSVKSCQANSSVISKETVSGTEKRVNFAPSSPNSNNVSIGKYNLKDVPRNGFTSVMV